MKRFTQVLLAAFVCSTIGCASAQLRRTAPRHAETLSGIYEQQVLDNLAAFAANRGSTPSFAVPTAGTSGISHGNTAAGNLMFNPTTFTGAGLSLNGTRMQAVNWTMRPVTERRRLELMKCVFQHAVCRSAGDCCEDCSVQLSAFFEGDTSPCKIPRGFFRVAKHRPVSVDDCCVKSGSSCGVHITVPAKNYECLSRLTMAIMDIATISAEDLAVRLDGDPEERVEVTETFITYVDGNETLVQGTYSVSEEEFENEIEQKRVPTSKLIKRATAMMQGDAVPELDEGEGSNSSQLNRSSPMRPMRALRGGQGQSNAVDEIESQLQFQLLQ